MDTSAFIALNDSRDQFHLDASKIAENIKNYELYITDAVINETHTLLRYRLGFQSASFFLQSVLSGLPFVITPVTEEIRLSAFHILEQYNDQKISYCDALSVAIMRAHHINNVFAFDHHFDVMGVERLQL